MRRYILRSLCLPGLLTGLFLLTVCRSNAGSQAAPATLTAAAQATELPFGPWGPFALTHIGPCCLVSRLPQKLFSFPIVIGQERDEVTLQMEKSPEGRMRLRTERIVLERRAMGLAPVQATGDDKSSAADAGENRHAQIMEADPGGLLWGARLRFAPAAVVQDLAPRHDDSGKPVPPSDWGAGEASVEYFPAYADPAADGLLVRVTLSNHSDTPQTWFVDLLGGIEVTGPAFALQDLTVSPQADASVTLQHGANAPVFALAAGAAPVSSHSYHVSDAYFLASGNETRRDETGAALPPGLPASAVESSIPIARDRGRKRKASPKGKVPNVGAPETGGWGLVRLDGLAVAPGQTVTVFLCVGAGKDETAARNSARILLPLAGDVTAGDTPREGAYAKALAADRIARFNSGSESLDRLVAQSLANTPLFDYRRVGVPTRQDRPGRPGGVYTPAEGGYMALGWGFFRPDFAAAQLNATFLTQGKADPPVAHPQAVPPTNLFALWELYQRTHDHEMLTLFYPFARRRYLEFLAAGRQKGQEGLYAWPVTTSSNTLHYSGAPASASAEAGKLLFAPDYAAYVIRAARVLERIAEDLHLPPSEIAGYAQDREAASRALNDHLWDPARGLYGSQPFSGGATQASGALSGLLPLIAGADALPADRRAALLKALADPALFWSKAGLRSVSKSAAAYHADVAEQGAVHIGPNWLLWKALLDLGETETARKLAETVVSAYTAAQTTSGACPEWLDGDTGAPGGARDYAGDACAAIPLYAAYHLPGTISTGWDIDVLDSRYDKTGDTLHLVFRTRNVQIPGTLLCVLGKPNGKYTLTGALQGTVTADANGALTLAAPHDATTQSLDIAPAGK